MFVFGASLTSASLSKNKFFDFTHLNINTILGIGIVFVSTALISFCSYILVEKKLGNLLNQVSRN